MASRPGRGTCCLLLLAALVAAAVLAAPALEARGGPKAEPAGPTGEAGGPLTAEALERAILDHPAATWALLLGKAIPVLVGIVLLVLWYVKRDKQRAGMLPPPLPVVPTRPFDLGLSLLLAGGAMVLAPLLILMLLLRGAHPDDATLWQQTVAMMGGTLPLAVWVVVARWRKLPGRRPQPIEAPDEFLSPRLARAPRPARAVGLGLWALCVSAVVFIPGALVWSMVLQGFDAVPLVQEPVRDMVEGQEAYMPWLMVGFGVLVAPFAEECIFRGMLYPAMRDALGGTRSAVWISALVVSLLFAGVHGNLYALVPLFLLALVLTWVFETTNSLAAVVIAHALHNGLTMIPLLALRS